MLPEKRKNLIIAIVAIILLVILIIVLASISNYIKMHTDTGKSDNDYLDKYSYIGITYDEEDTLYKIYGITSNFEEEYLNIGTFYNVKDAIIRNNRLVMYSDATNELRYDSKQKEYYFYELDLNYNRNTQVILTNDYIINRNNGIISIHKYGDDINEDVVINENESFGNYILNNNKIYYSQQNGIYEYDINVQANKRLIYNNEATPLSIISVSDKYMFYYNLGNIPMLYRFDGERITALEDFIKDTTFIDLYSDTLLLEINDESGYKLKKYSLKSHEYEDYELDLQDNLVTKSIKVNSDLYYLEYTNNAAKTYNLLNIKNNNIIKLNHNYDYFMGVE